MKYRGSDLERQWSPLGLDGVVTVVDRCKLIENHRFEVTYMIMLTDGIIETGHSSGVKEWHGKRHSP